MIQGDTKDKELNIENNTRLFEEHFRFVLQEK